MITQNNMWKTLNLELFKPWFMFSFKWNKHLVIKDYQEEVLVINLNWDDCWVFETLSLWFDKSVLNLDNIFKDIENSLYRLSYLDILEDILHSDTLRWEDIDYTLLIEEENDNTDASYS